LGEVRSHGIQALGCYYALISRRKRIQRREKETPKKEWNPAATRGKRKPAKDELLRVPISKVGKKKNS